MGRWLKISPPSLFRTKKVTGYWADFVKANELRSCKKVRSPMILIIGKLSALARPKVVAMLPSIPETPLEVWMETGLFLLKKKAWASLIGMLLPRKRPVFAGKFSPKW